MSLPGSVMDYLRAFGAGVVVSLSPCVYPVIPLTASLIAGANAGGRKWRGFVLSLIYVLGLAVTYCAMGVAASLTGKVFGHFQNHPAVLAAVGLLLVIFGLMMMDWIQLPGWGQGLQRQVRVKNASTVFLFGITSGLVVGPCTAPILGTLLLYVASQQNVLHAVSLLFVFSYGVGFSLILVGTFSGLVSRLPRSGPWLARIKQVSAFVLFAAAGYYFFKAGRSWF